MAKFDSEIPNELLKQIGGLADGGADDMIDEMLTEAGEYVEGEVRSNAKRAFRNPNKVLRGLFTTKVYRTKKDDAKNVKVGFSGYLPGSPKTKRHPKGTPTSLVAMAREYGTSRGEAKRPFLRKAFKKNRITLIMQNVQKKYIPEE